MTYQYLGSINAGFQAHVRVMEMCLLLNLEREYLNNTILSLVAKQHLKHWTLIQPYLNNCKSVNKPNVVFEISIRLN